jgi:CheY-like chemotaxis protein
MTHRLITILVSKENSQMQRWRTSAHVGSRIVPFPDVATVQRTIAGRRDRDPFEVERVIIDNAATASEFLLFLATLPAEFKGDVLFVEGYSRAFLSAAGVEGRRSLYTLDADDVDFYCAVYALRDMPNLNAASSCEAVGRMRKVRVLVAEDDDKTREILATLLEDLGCESFIARGGLEAIRLANENHPQVIFLDGLMPEMHGFEAARIIRQNAGYTPRIIMLTGVYKNTKYRNEAKLRYGIDGYLIKPVSREEFASAIFDENGMWRLDQAAPALTTA